MLNLFEKSIGGYIRKHVNLVRAKFKNVTNVDKMGKKLFRDVMGKVRSMFSLRPQAKADYVKAGRTYIAKKVILMALVGVLAFLFVFHRFLYPWAEGRFWVPELTINTERFYVYSGKAKVLDTYANLLYVGDLDDGRINGKGSLYHPDGHLVYRGDFVNELYEGKGERFAADGSVIYRGDFKANAYHGEGQLFENGNLLYEGQFQDGLFHGEGQLYHDNGNVRLTGNFRAGHLEGEGKEYTADGSLLYHGFFLDGLYNGTGTIYNPELKTVSYEGQFRKGRHEGFGRLYDQESGRIVYEGEFSEGRYHGEGKLYNWKGQDVYVGHFYQGEIDYFRYIDAPIDIVREEFGNESRVQFFDFHYLLEYHDLTMMFAFENPIDRDPEVHKILFLGGQDFLGGPIGMSIERLKDYYGENEFEFYYLIDDEKRVVLERLRLPVNLESLYSVKYILHSDIFVRYYALNPQGDILYFEMGGL
ncbi:hypothetical protein [Desulfuribacillus alkaliarsenatis]|uniref:Uncharacterized protein n=1 Tax=Desulfuribacillus alkaliarsenatis TaxID=766136 RepID=A0A1E5G2F5_9FIRM|nr:hypothetical protein [Desulfuribacillus alkaliarsenatis]OEF97124.1 hypothetical protein BHF68_05880 [Desulfuribacillus alkaliarsenatis]